MAELHVSNAVCWYLNDVTAKIVAGSGVPSDRYHIGKMVLRSLKEDPDFIAQIDGGTGESEDNESLLRRTVQCAISFRNMGLRHGDVIVLMGPNHLELVVPWYAAMYLGVVVAPVDRTLKVAELEHTFKIYKPSAIFCQSEKVPEIKEALENQKWSAKIFTFDQSDGASLSDLLDADEEQVKNFEASDFNAEESIATILPTSGSTGLFKGAAITYKTWTITGPHIWSRFTKFPAPSQSWLILSPAQWLAGALHFMVAPYIKYTRIQTSKPVSEDHVRHLIKTYRPTCSAIPASVVRRLLSGQAEDKVDMTCFDLILMAGSAVDKETVGMLKAASPRTAAVNAFGMTELSTIAFQGDCPPGASGKPAGIYQHRLINLDTKGDIDEPLVCGELWLKGPMFKEYINNPEATAAAFAADGWFRTGDLFYRDQHHNYYFVERIKLLLKYKHYQIAPTEIEAILRAVPGVVDAAVTAAPHADAGELPVAFVVRAPGAQLTADDIKRVVKEKLSDAKQLRGGVAFVTSFPLTSSGKINRVKLREMAKQMDLE